MNMVMKKVLDEKINHYSERVDSVLEYWLPTKKITPEKLHQAMQYSVFNGGKRIRPLLTYLTAEALGVPAEEVDGIAASVECIHAYSLIHDDLPAMDDDDLRRGKPTCHKKFDEATAILAGDALQTLAFQILSSETSVEAKPESRLKMISILSQASGSRGMVGGQAIDLDSENKKLEIAELENMHIHKTGALIHASVSMVTMVIDDIDPDLRARLEHYSKCIGLAFQVKDDILDIESDTESLGKPQGSDVANNKSTYPSLIGLKESKELARELIDEALESLDRFGEEALPLRELAEFIIDRKK